MDELLRLMKTKKIPGGLGFVFNDLQRHTVLSSDTKLDDIIEGKNKWKLGVSVSSGCNVGCIYCFTNRFAGYKKLSMDEIVYQADYMWKLNNNNPGIFDEIKIEFKEMGDPVLNAKNVALAIERLDQKYNTQKLMYVVSTSGVKAYSLFEKLAEQRTKGANIRLQFSCHTTSDKEKKILSPNLQMFSLHEIGEIVDKWYNGTSRTTLTFVPLDGFELNPEKIKNAFDPEKVFVKLSYLDNTAASKNFGLNNASKHNIDAFVQGLKQYGFKYAYRHTSGTNSQRPAA